MDILLKGINEHNCHSKVLKVLKAVSGDNDTLAKKIRTKQGYKTSEIKAQEKYEAQYMKHYDTVLRRLYDGITQAIGVKTRKALDDYKPFKIKGKVFYSPKTGKPLTIKEWNSIKQAISKFLGDNTNNLAEKIATEQQSIGTILQRLEEKGVRVSDTTPNDISGKVFDTRRDYQKEYDWSQEELYGLDNNIARLGNDITGINDNIRKKIVTTLNDGLVNKLTGQEISSNLLFTMEGMNRDWQRIVAYESQANFQYGYLNSELKFAPPEETIYVQAISQPDACKYCKSLLNGGIYILTKDTGKIGQPAKDDYAEGYVVLGSTNISNRPMDYVPTIPLHPHCRCRWVRWYPEYWELEQDIKS